MDRKLNINNGFILINKPPGISSFKVIPKIRLLTKESRVGHAGTLDPFASGLLIIAIGRQFTKQISKFQDLYKIYKVKMELGKETDTLDPEGKVTFETSQSKLSEFSQENLKPQIEAIFQEFLGEQLQTPPMFSAKKVDGERLYKLARAGKIVEIEPKKVYFHDFKLDSIEIDMVPYINFTVKCSKGTYIRSLVRDIGHKLGTYAYTKELVREQIGVYNVADSMDFDTLDLEQIKKNLFYKCEG
jgi:tRNA pseudouridine55 synthase